MFFFIFSLAFLIFSQVEWVYFLCDQSKQSSEQLKNYVETLCLVNNTSISYYHYKKQCQNCWHSRIGLMTCDNLKNKFEGYYEVDACHNNITDRCSPNLWDANNLCDGGYYSCGPKASISNAFCFLYASQAVKQYLNVTYTIANGSVMNAIAVADFGTDINGESSDQTNMIFGETNIKCYYNAATRKSPIHFWGHPIIDIFKLGMALLKLLEKISEVFVWIHKNFIKYCIDPCKNPGSCCSVRSTKNIISITIYQDSPPLPYSLNEDQLKIPENVHNI
ncbi:37318_t:CDS:2 [Gigaspora margarita]|uniref:37318_t:CDS:1 n=1 Tax=Gigaspora margarita TaxID=4874 RepID=A0ABM8VXA8_GIGMA|nr:37318_t:CDS:2 [Gigaspora margarita]